MNTTDSSTILTMLIVSLLALAVWFLYLLTLKGLLQEINPENRKLQVSQIWLLLIPVFNVIWFSWVVYRISKSVRLEFADRGLRRTKRVTGEMAAYVSWVLAVFSPFNWKLLLPASLFFGVAHWVRWYAIKSRLEGFRDIP
jgi:uncharacterized membrane protein